MKSVVFSLLLALVSVIHLDGGPHIGALPQLQFTERASAQDFEPYSVRPNILEVEPHQSTLASTWRNLKQAHIAMAVELFALYPQSDLGVSKRRHF